MTKNAGIPSSKSERLRIFMDTAEDESNRYYPRECGRHSALRQSVSRSLIRGARTRDVNPGRIHLWEYIMRAHSDATRLADLLIEYSELPEFVELKQISIRTRGHFGNTPLHVAAARASSAEVELLLHAGAEVDAVGEHGYTPLHDAVAQGALDIVRLLLQHGAGVGTKNALGASPKDLPMTLGHERIVQELNQHPRTDQAHRPRAADEPDPD